MQGHTSTEFRCCCFNPNCLNAGTFLVLHQVHSRVNVRVRASTADDLIKEPDQVKGFPQDIMSGVVVPILSKLVLGTALVLAQEHAIRQFDIFPFPPASVAGF